MKIKHLGMVNILAQREVVRELVQHDLSASTLAAVTLELLQDQTKREALQADLASITTMLGSGGAYQRAAEAVHHCSS